MGQKIDDSEIDDDSCKDQPKLIEDDESSKDGSTLIDDDNFEDRNEDELKLVDEPMHYRADESGKNFGLTGLKRAH